VCSRSDEKLEEIKKLLQNNIANNMVSFGFPENKLLKLCGSGRV